MPTSESVAIRPAVRDDIAGIVQVCASSIEPGEDEGFAVAGVPSRLTDVARLSAAWEDPNRVGSEEVLVAEADARLVGVVTIEERGPELELVDIDVPRDLQGRGIGGRLVRFVEMRARSNGQRAVTLGTSRNAAGVPWKSLPWWTSLGYRITHEEENAWTRSIGPGAREIRMRKDVYPIEHVDLREVGEEDLPILFEQQRHPAAVRMAAFTTRDPSDREAFRAHWSRILADATVVTRVVVVEGRVAGSVGRFLDPSFAKPEVTCWIAREYWGRGVATLALTSFLRTQRERPIYARAAADNAASIRALEKCGFREVARGRDYANARGQEIEEVILELRASS